MLHGTPALFKAKYHGMSMAMLLTVTMLCYRDRLWNEKHGVGWTKPVICLYLGETTVGNFKRLSYIEDNAPLLYFTKSKPYQDISSAYMKMFRWIQILKLPISTDNLSHQIDGEHVSSLLIYLRRDLFYRKNEPKMKVGTWLMLRTYALCHWLLGNKWNSYSDVIKCQVQLV